MADQLSDQCSCPRDEYGMPRAGHQRDCPTVNPPQEDRMGLIRHSLIEDAAEDLDATAENYRRTAASSAPEIRQRWLDQAERYERMAATVRGAVEALERIERGHEVKPDMSGAHWYSVRDCRRIAREALAATRGR